MNKDTIWEFSGSSTTNHIFEITAPTQTAAEKKLKQLQKTGQLNSCRTKTYPDDNGIKIDFVRKKE